MSSVTAIELTAPPKASVSRQTNEKRRRLPLVQQYLREQQELTAVERFSTLHERGFSERTSRYEALLPTRSPQSGEQYAFRVDLDKCTGCKACVTACHNLNGLDEGETWRSVGLVVGGAEQEPFQRTVTTACHHCVEPACLSGCPVKAYEKDEETGIVRHLDDQCIGCRYCTLTCPYEVPQFNERLGIVRKCDMCSDRLQEGEAPACVQACPNEAISIEVVDQQDMIGRAESGAMVPGAASSALSVPTTTYHTEKVFPKTARAADLYRVRPAPNHGPLAVMLVLTQASVGAFALEWLLSFFGSEGAVGPRAYHVAAALLAGLLALSASILHIGRPGYAFRALLGLRTSWLSREILIFGAFAGVASAYAATAWASVLDVAPWPVTLQQPLMTALGAAVVSLGGVGIFCSVMLYCVTGKLLWSGASTGIKFFSTAVVLGSAVTIAVRVGGAVGAASAPFSGSLIALLVAATSVKLTYEAFIFTHLGSTTHGELKRSALVMVGPLSTWTVSRFAAGMAGGVLLPLLLWAELTTMGVTRLAVIIALLSLAVSIVGELLERALFFRALCSPRMPGIVD